MGRVRDRVSNLNRNMDSVWDKDWDRNMDRDKGSVWDKDRDKDSVWDKVMHMGRDRVCNKNWDRDKDSVRDKVMHMGRVRNKRQCQGQGLGQRQGDAVLKEYMTLTDLQSAIMFGFRCIKLTLFS